MMNMMTLNSYQVGGNHYASKDIQPWDVMQAWMTKEAFAGYLHGNCIKYLARYLEKNGAEDLKKCKHYLSKLIELEENKALGIKDVLQYQAGREAAELGFNRYGLGNEDWLTGYDKAKAKTNE
jgi:hypothetical protein